MRQCVRAYEVFPVSTEATRLRGDARVLFDDFQRCYAGRLAADLLEEVHALAICCDKHVGELVGRRDEVEEVFVVRDSR